MEACALSPDGPALVFYDDAARTAADLPAPDAASWAEFARSTGRVAGVLQALVDAPAPDAASPSIRDILRLGGLYRRTRALDRGDAHRLLQWLPMPIADMVGDWFESDLLRAAVAAPGLLGTSNGPRAAGSTLVWLTRLAHRMSAHPSPMQIRGGPGALTRAMARAAEAAGAEIRFGKAVERIVVRDGRVTGVIAGGEEIEADCVVSGADPKTTFLTLMDSTSLPTEFAAQIGHYRSSGSVAKLNLALSALPAFRGVAQPAHLSGRVHIGPSLDYLEQASDATKYGDWSPEPWMEVSIPSVLDDSLAPAGAHVASIYVHAAPRQLKNRDWPAERERLSAACLRLLEQLRAGHRLAGRRGRAADARRHRAAAGRMGRARIPRRPGAGPVVRDAAHLGLGAPRHACARPLPVRRGNPSGRIPDGNLRTIGGGARVEGVGLRPGARVLTKT